MDTWEAQKKTKKTSKNYSRSTKRKNLIIDLTFTKIERKPHLKFHIISIYIDWLEGNIGLKELEQDIVAFNTP